MASESVAPEQLLRLNEEVALLVRAGVPLEQGLRDARGGMPRRVRELIDRLVDRLEAGQSLDAAIESEGDRLPPMYQAVIQAGLRSGRLPDALLAYSGHVQTYLAFRESFWRALMYPSIVVAVAWLLAVAFAVFFVPTVLEASTWIDGPASMAVSVAKFAHETVWLWGWSVPLLMMFVLWRVWTGCKSAFLAHPDREEATHSTFWMFVVPGLPWIIRQIQLARFTEAMALFLEYRLPMHQAVVLAGTLSGSSAISHTAKRAERMLLAGTSPTECFLEQQELPHLVRWTLSHPLEGLPLEVALRQLADLYQRRAAVFLNLFRVAFPVTVTIVLGGGAALAYGGLVFLPLHEILQGVLQR